MLKLKKTRDPIELDVYSTREKELNSLYRPDNFYARKWVANIAVALFVFIDFWCLQTVWNLVCRPENIIFIYAIAVGCAVALDVPLAIGGYSLKGRHQGLIGKKENMVVMILSVSVFFIAFAFSFIFRLVTRDVSYSLQNTNLVSVIASGTLGSDPAAVTADNTSGNTAVLVAALFNGVIPLLTSMASFVISYYGYLPLEEQLLRLRRRIIRLDSNISDIKTAVIEAGTPEEYRQTLIEREYSLFDAHKENIRAEGETLRQTAYLIIMEKLGNSQMISAVTQAAAKSVARLKSETEDNGRCFSNNTVEVYVPEHSG